MKRACFFRKVPDIGTLKKCTMEELRNGKQGKLYHVFRIIELSDEEFESFANNLLEDRDFIAETMNEAIVNPDDVWYCLLVKPKGDNKGILVHASGYYYSRYSAYIPDCRELSEQTESLNKGGVIA